MKDKNKNIDNSGCIQTNASCVIWNLPPIKCLGIKTGDRLDTVTFAIVEKICNSMGNTDLEDIELQCILDKFDINEPSERTIVSLLQLAFDNECALYDLIQEVKALIQDDTKLTLDLKCLKQLDSYGNQIDYTEQTVLQSLINSVCILFSNLESISASILSINQRIDDLPAPYTEPNLTTCLSGTPRTSSQTLQLLASDYCAYKPKVGTVGEIDAAIGAQPTVVDVTDPLFNNSDLINPVNSLANSDQNQWVFLNSLFTRIKQLEACACKFKCSDIKLMFNVEDQEDGNQVVLNFSGDYGNFIPDSFDVDTDSTITFIDKNKSQKTYTIPTGDTDTLNTEWVSPSYDISMLDLTGMLTIKVCVKLKDTETDQICCKCEEVQHMFVGACSFCEITASEDTTIVFKNSSDNLQSTDIKAGDSYVLPSNSKVISIDPSKLVTVPECLDLTNIEELSCFVASIGSYSWNTGPLGSTDRGFWEGQGTGHRIIGLEINNISYMLPSAIVPISGNARGEFAMNTEVAPAIKALNGIILESNGFSNIEPSAGNMGVSINHIQIKTVASYGTKINLIVRSLADASISGNKEVTAYIKFIPYEDAVSQGYASLPTSLCDDPLT